MLKYLEQQGEGQLDLEKLEITEADVNGFMASEVYKIFVSDLELRRRLIVDEIPNAPLSSIEGVPGLQTLQGELSAINFVITYFDDLKKQIRSIEEKRESKKQSEVHDEQI